MKEKTIYQIALVLSLIGFAMVVLDAIDYLTNKTNIPDIFGLIGLILVAVSFAVSKIYKLKNRSKKKK
jgi:hypothetical protein